ncbi:MULTISPECIES: hypothetical protein [Metabacillus]|uniref:hypothetical protein n=1 Tax=Metabacillus TaxID=2675233 RepID=UPI000C805119|nr:MULTISPECIES: hypothetical protein [Metabacillus]MCM3443949.1 hypothetical protein [Metabacillus halosaccharovorans]PMC34998.1 hypothetical protein CJ195_21055 [Bacillus sp. UMB0899]
MYKKDMSDKLKNWSFYVFLFMIISLCFLLILGSMNSLIKEIIASVITGVFVTWILSSLGTLYFLAKVRKLKIQDLNLDSMHDPKVIGEIGNFALFTYPQRFAFCLGLLTVIVGYSILIGTFQNWNLSDFGTGITVFGLGLTIATLLEADVKERRLYRIEQIQFNTSNQEIKNIKNSIDNISENLDRIQEIEEIKKSIDILFQKLDRINEKEKSKKRYQR